MRTRHPILITLFILTLLLLATTAIIAQDHERADYRTTVFPFAPNDETTYMWMPSVMHEFDGGPNLAVIVREENGIPRINAQNEQDLFFTQGWVHAEDRLFQMDVLRRTASGTLAELIGQAGLGQDVQFRYFGLRRAAEKSVPMMSAETSAALDAYAAGINAYVATHPLPPEYAILEITRFHPWTPLDSLSGMKLLTFSLSFDLDLDLTETLAAYNAAGSTLGFDGASLFSEDMYRSAPFDPASTIPDSGGPAFQVQVAPNSNTPLQNLSYLQPGHLTLVADYLDEVKNITILQDAIDPRNRDRGSNEWAVAGKYSADGNPMIANDPHLALDTPATFYQNHLQTLDGAWNVIGSSFPGTPFVILGANDAIAWGATINPLDVTDTYAEIIVVDGDSPSGFSTLYQGAREPIIAIPQAYQANQIGDGVPDNLVDVPLDPLNGGMTLIVPRRNDGPVINVNITTGDALSVQYTGWSGTTELDAFRTWNRAENLDDFKTGLEHFDVGSQNFIYVDVAGNIAYFTSAEMPIREDLQNLNFPDGGIPPYFVRDGTGTLQHEWMPVQNPQSGQNIPYEILPFAEMPQVINPVNGFVINANNDPIGVSLDNNPLNQLRSGGGIYYLNPGYAIGTRAGRITRLLENAIRSGPVSREDMKSIQANVQMLDAEMLTPFIVNAYSNAQAATAPPELAALAADPSIAEAINRLQVWDFSAPTGILQGYDAADENGVLSPPTQAEIDASISATIYSVWRGQMIGNTIDATLAGMGLSQYRPGSAQAMTALDNLLSNFSVNEGIGASGVNFFDVPGVADAGARRDIILLQSLRDALDLLAGPRFAAAFEGSSDQNDYRWGYLHRIVLDHILGEPFSIPTADGAFQPSIDNLPGIAVDGGFGVVDASSHSARADSVNEFMFGSGPVRRYVGGPGPGGVITGESSLPGGESGVLGNPFYFNLLPNWLTNDTHPYRMIPPF